MLDIVQKNKACSCTKMIHVKWGYFKNNGSAICEMVSLKELIQSTVTGLWQNSSWKTKTDDNLFTKLEKRSFDCVDFVWCSPKKHLRCQHLKLRAIIAKKFCFPFAIDTSQNNSDTDSTWQTVLIDWLPIRMTNR